MKRLHLTNSSYKALLINFKEWLDILGFAQASVYNLPNHIQEFFYYLEQHHITSIDTITPTIVKQYYKYLQERPNEMRGGGLSKNYLNSHIQSLKKLKEYLQKHNAKNIPLHIKPEHIERLSVIDVLTQSEVKELFEATAYTVSNPHIQQRDKAMLVVLYSCGLRRNEASMLAMKDVLFDRELILVRKGKNYKERYVPINSYNLEILEKYMYDARTYFINHSYRECLFLGLAGSRLSGEAMARRLQQIITATKNQDIIEKNITPHKLRHSIATHFLQAGMPIEDIKQFLGHSHLETTQIYTHLIEKL